MDRRNFVISGLAASIGAGLAPKMAFGANSENNEVLKGFIVSDAHFGWDGAHQPDPEKQAKAMRNIINRFPDLDVFFDTGDAHHNDHHENLNPEKAREDWIDIIQGGCGQVPFYYILGNHEIRSDEVNDPEMRCNIMGSSTCRPYYSFDLNGIHFISFPELIRAVYITEEEYAWLELDLRINSDKTIILLSHNNIIGTTEGNAAGYRGLLDSEKLLQIFKQNPNIIAWMHGHNHNYEIVKAQDMLFVSNGRIGGFDPSGGKHGIGGIYFEVSKEGLLVRCYSAEFDKFLDEEEPQLASSLKKSTSLNAYAIPAYSFGIGNAVAGERVPAYIHHAGNNGKAELFLTGTSGSNINENSKFERYVERWAWHGLDKQLFTAKITARNDEYEYLNPGIRLKENNNWWTSIILSGDNSSRYSYFRCPVGRDYKVVTDIDAAQGKQVLLIRLHICTIEGKVLQIVQSPKIKIEEGKQQIESELHVPKLEVFDTIYSNSNSDNLVHIAVELCFTGMNAKIDVSEIRFSQADTSEKTSNPGLSIGNEKYQYDGILEKGEIKKFNINPLNNNRVVGEVLADGNKRMTYLVRTTGSDWQVRNATVADEGNYLYVKEMRNTMSRKMEIVFTPIGKNMKAPYLYKIRKAEEIKVYPVNRGNRHCRVEVGVVKEKSQLEFWSPVKPSKIKGVNNWKYNENIVLAEITNPGTVEIIL